MNKSIFTALSVSLLLGTSAAGASLYVSDTLHVPLRSGPSTSHRIFTTLKSGDKVKVLDADEENGFIEVATASGKEGYMPKRYLMATPTAALKLARAERTANNSNKKVEELRETLKTMRTELANQKKAFAELAIDRKKTVGELANLKFVSGNAVKIAEEKNRLEALNKKLGEDNRKLKDKNRVLMENSQNEGIRLGISAVALGVIMGLILPFLKPRSNRRFSNSIRIS